MVGLAKVAVKYWFSQVKLLLLHNQNIIHTQDIARGLRMSFKFIEKRNIDCSYLLLF